MIKKVAFIGVGYMGYGVAKNLILKNFNLKVIAHKNKKPIDKLKKIGAIEVDNYDDLLKDIDCLFLCVTNTPIAISIAKEIKAKTKEGLLVVDITTHNKDGSLKMKEIFGNQIKCFVVYFIHL